MLNKAIRYFLENKLVTSLLLLAWIAWGLVTAPFSWEIDWLPSDPVSVDAIPDIGENQQIVFTAWAGRSPQDIEDQITYPLTTALLGISGVKSIRSSSIFGVSSIYIIFDEEVDFYWSRSRILEKLNSLPAGLLPEKVQPSLGPDATALGQVYWYTLEGRDKTGNPTGGWDLHEIRTIQDFYVKYSLNAVKGVAEVASIGGFIQEYQIDVNPDALKNYGISLHQVMAAVQKSNRDVGAKTIEINQVEYLIRGLGYIKSIEDIEKAVVSVQNYTPIHIKDIAVVSLGPATRRGVLDKDGAEVVGGVVVARYGANPLQVINQLKEKIGEISAGLPKKTLANGLESQLTIVPFYDRTGLIQESLGTLEEALSLEVFITILVVMVMVMNLRASLLISSLLPIAVLMVFIAMRYTGVEANIVALSGIAIAIGTMVDLGIILSENILKELEKSDSQRGLQDIIYQASAEVSSAILTAVATTIVSFVPVFTMEAAEGKLFRPLAFTKTFALIAALLVALFILPMFAHWIFRFRMPQKTWGKIMNIGFIIGGLIIAISIKPWAGIALIAFGTTWFLQQYFPKKNKWIERLPIMISIIIVSHLLAHYWLPLGLAYSLMANTLFVGIVLFVILGGFMGLEHYYSLILSWCLAHKKRFLLLPVMLILLGLTSWLGADRMLSPIAKGMNMLGWEIQESRLWKSATHTFPGIGNEFMPSLDEGSFLLMPTSMPHAGMAQNKRVVQQLDMLVANIPEVALAVGKMGRVASALDPAPISMYENIINYKPEYRVDKHGHRARYRTDEAGNYFLKTSIISTSDERDEKQKNTKLGKDKSWILFEKDTIRLNERGQAMTKTSLPVSQLMSHLEDYLIPDSEGDYFRNWRAHIHSPDDIWAEIVRVTKLPGVTSAPKLQPIETRLVMLQTGMRAPMGIKVYGPDLPTIEAFALQLEQILQTVPQVKKEAVFADRVVGKPYLHLTINRDKIARYGLSIEEVQQTIETAIGGKQITTTVEGRERFPVRVRYPRELRNDPAALAKIYMATPTGVQVPLGDMVEIDYLRGPQMIKSENTFLVAYVLFDKQQGVAEVEAVEAAQAAIQQHIEEGKLALPAGVSYKFSGNYENQLRAEKRLKLIVPLVLGIIFLILYFQFKSISTSLMVFAGIAMAFSGAFLLIWCYGQEGFLNVSIVGLNFRDLFQIHPINMSVAVWVGFIALFGIATDDGVLLATYLDQSKERHQPNSIQEIRETVTKAGKKRIKPAIMTSATTIIALLPVLTSTGRGADIMIPMAIPAFGGMLVAAITYFITPVLYSMREEWRWKRKS